MMTTTVTVHGVLAGAYKGGRKSLNNLRTHGVESVDGSWSKVLCNKVTLDSICDEEEGAEPTCQACRRKMKLPPL